MKNQYEIDYQQGYDKANGEWLDRMDKIRAEIAELSHYYPMGHDYQIAITRCIAVIDKYRAEQEET